MIRSQFWLLGWVNWESENGTAFSKNIDVLTEK